MSYPDSGDESDVDLFGVVLFSVTLFGEGSSVEGAVGPFWATVFVPSRLRDN